MKWMMGQGAKAMAAAVALQVLTGCGSPPPLKQVDPSAEEKPINAPETAALLKQKYQKSSGSL